MGHVREQCLLYQPPLKRKRGAGRDSRSCFFKAIMRVFREVGIDALHVVLQKTLDSPLDCREIQPVHSKGNQS